MDGTSGRGRRPPRRERLVRWSRQAHVLLGLLLVVKLLWFDEQVDVGLVPFFLWAATLGTAILLVCWLPLLRERPRLVAIVVVDVLVSTTILVDLLHYRFFSTLVSLSLVPQAGQTDDVAASIVELFRWTDLWLYVDVVVLGVLVLSRRSRAILAPAGEFRSSRSRELVVFATITGVAVLGFPVTALVRPGPFNVAWDMMGYQLTGLVGFHVYDAARFAHEQWGEDDATQAELDLVDARLSEDPPQVDLRGAPAAGTFEGSNVLMIQVEALEATVLGRRYDGLEITPHLNDLVTRSVTFADTHHQVGAGHTADAEWLTGCSLYPARRGTAFIRFADNEMRCLPEMLREQGYAARAHHANDEMFWNRAAVYPAIGYDTFYSREHYTGEPLGTWGIGDRDFLAQTVPRLLGRDQPSYDLAITLTSHHPYTAPLPEGSRRVSGQLDGSIMGDYLDSVAYADAALGELIDQLEADGTWDRSIVVVYGDHDSGISDPALRRELSGRSLSDYELALQRQQIPMIVHLPGDASAGLQIRQPVGQIDVAPMLARLLGLPARDTQHLLGTDPFTARTRPVVLRNGGFVSSEHLLVSPAGPCFDRSSGVEVGIAACEVQRAQAAAELAVSDSINDHDLFRQLVPR